MTGPARTAAVLVDELAAISCPVDRAVEVTTVASSLRSALAKLRRDALSEARGTHPVRDIAKRLGRTRSCIYDLTKTHAAEQAP